MNIDIKKAVLQGQALGAVGVCTDGVYQLQLTVFTLPLSPASIFPFVSPSAVSANFNVTISNQHKVLSSSQLLKTVFHY